MSTNDTADNATPGEPGQAQARAHKAGAFDIRSFIGLLIGIYGVVLVIAGLFDSDAEIKKADGIHINLYAGIAMVIVAVFFLLWARLKPVIVPDEIDPEPTSEG